MEEIIKSLLQEIGEDPNREGLLKTPERVKKAYEFLTQGYHQDPYEIIGDAQFTEECEEMILVKDISLYSLCEHHILPFFGKIHVAYIPNYKIVGLSKIPRITDAFSRRLQVQERLTNQVASVLDEVLSPKGVAVVIEASHMCMQMRGVQKRGSTMVTSSMRGIFRDNLNTRNEFMNLIKS